jgi:hypothetical protein
VTIAAARLLGAWSEVLTSPVITELTPDGRWMESGDDEPFLPCVAATSSDLQQRAAERGSVPGTALQFDASLDRFCAEEISGNCYRPPFGP